MGNFRVWVKRPLKEENIDPTPPQNIPQMSKNKVKRSSILP
jgi:hypothetical protein